MKAAIITISLLLLSGTARAQTGTITGNVFACLDSCDPIPGASVHLLAGETVLRTVVSDKRGNFVFLGVPSGREYVLESELAGLAGRRMHTWYLFAGQTQKVPLPLDWAISSCNLGRRWRIDRPIEPPGVFRFRVEGRSGPLVAE